MDEHDKRRDATLRSVVGIARFSPGRLIRGSGRAPFGSAKRSQPDSAQFRPNEAIAIVQNGAELGGNAMSRFFPNELNRKPLLSHCGGTYVEVTRGAPTGTFLLVPVDQGLGALPGSTAPWSPRDLALESSPERAAVERARESPPLGRSPRIDRHMTFHYWDNAAHACS
jgi:hypothetical protein